MDDRTFEFMKLRYQHHHDSNRDMFASVMEASSQALKASFIMNGAATIALLALMGSTASNPPAQFADFLPNAAIAAFYFSLGVLFTAISTGLKYLVQAMYAQATADRYQPEYPYTEEDYKELLKSWGSADKLARNGNRLNYITIFFVICAYLWFIKGVFKFGSTFGLSICSLF